MDRRAIEDLFRTIAPVAIKRMFGGHGIYADGLMFALEAGGEIYLKSDDVSRAIFDGAGLRAFQFASKRGVMVTSYRLLPEEAHEDADVLKGWVRLARDAAQRSADKTSRKRQAKGKLKAAANSDA